jgi:hypothetical protein
VFDHYLNMVLRLFDSNGNVKAEFQPDDSSVQEKEIQGDSLLKLSFTLYKFVSVDVNDYVDYCGERYWAVEKYAPTEKSSIEWEYSLQLFGVESLIKRFLVLNLTDGDNEAVFSLTARPAEHVRLIVQNINSGMAGMSVFKVGAVEGTDNVTIDYAGKYCDEALKELAETADTEWWIEGETVNLSRCEHGEEVALGYDNGLTSLDRDTAEGAKFYTRLFPIGSSRNIDAEKYGHSRLMLPNGAKYVDINVDKYGVIHHYEQGAFAAIYPRRVGTVSGVRSESVKDKEGKLFVIYYFKDDELPFNPNEYEIGGLVKRVSFQEGSELAGLGMDNDHYFEVNYNSDTREFEIITIWPYDDDTQLPGGTLVPKVGDRYILWNIRMPDEYYALAEQELLEAVYEYNRKHALDVSRYKAPTDHVWIEETGTELAIGRRIRLESSEYFPKTGYRHSRITRISRQVNMPSRMDLEISEALSRSGMSRLGDSITDVKNYVRRGLESLPDLIRTGDITRATDNNIYSALRSLKEFLSKTRDERVYGFIRFLKGIAVGEGDSGIDAEGKARLQEVVAEILKSPDFSKGLSDGTGFGVYTDEQGKTVAEVDKLIVRLKMIIQELEIRKLSYVGGDQVFSSAGSKISSVKFLPSGDYRCYIFADDGTTRTMNEWRIGDQAKCQTDNIKEGVYQNVSNRYYWRLVVGRGAETLSDGKTYNYIDLSNTHGAVDVVGEDGKTYTCVGYDTSTENDAPQAEDSIVQLGNQIDTERQYAYIIYVTEKKRVDYAGINDYDLSSHAVELHSASGGFVHSDRFSILSSSGTGVSEPIVCDRGAWTAGMVCGHYDRVSHNGVLWLCNVGKSQTTTEEPSEHSMAWIKQVDKGEKGDSPIQLDIYTDKGNIIRNGQGEIKLSAVVTRNGTDITAHYPPEAFLWTRNSGNEEYDTEWNNRHKGIGRSITVKAEDIWKKAVFECVIYTQ